MAGNADPLVPYTGNPDYYQGEADIITRGADTSEIFFTSLLYSDNNGCWGGVFSPLPFKNENLCLTESTEKIIGCAIEVHKLPGPGLEDMVILELKTVENFCPVHEAQILTYLKFANKSTGLLINFNVTVLKNGIKRYRM